MIVVGGVYREICVDQHIDQIFGSGGRAAVALAASGATVTLHTFARPSVEQRLRDSLEPAGVRLSFAAGTDLTTFRYLHSLARPVVSPWPISRTSMLSVEGEDVLVFGMMEGLASIKANRAVFDPQSSSPYDLAATGSSINHLAVVLNSEEILQATGKQDEAHAVSSLVSDLGAEVVVVKAGAVGARIYGPSGLIGSVPPYRTNRVFKIGSGDIFSTAFFEAWVVRQLPPIEAADYASRSTAKYCETRQCRLPKGTDITSLIPLTGAPTGHVYVASPFFALGDLWLVEETARALWAVGSKPFSPLHEIGIGTPQHVAGLDLQNLRTASAVLAIVSGSDPGTLFEVGYAVSVGIPVIVLAQNCRPADTTMPEGTGCFVTSDFPTAIYAASWATRK